MGAVTHIKDFINFFRSGESGGYRPIPAGASGQIYFGKEVTPQDVPKDGEVRPLESAVLSRICDMGSLVTWETDNRVMQKPEKTLSRSDWMRKLIYFRLTSRVISVCAIRDGITGLVTEYHIFSDATKPTATPGRAKDMETYSEDDRTYNVFLEDVMQFNGRVVPGEYKQLKMLRAAEDAYWVKMGRLNSHEGVIGLDDDVKIAGKSPEDRANFLKLMGKAMEKNAVAIMPPGYQGKEMMKSNSIALDVLYPVMVKQWCHFYGLPTSLMNLDLPTHTDVSLTAAYESFLKQRLIPTVQDVFEAIQQVSGNRIEVTYDRVERAGERESAEITKNLAQSGIFTINELRERWELPPIEGGENLPQPAGSGEQSKGGEDDQRTAV